MRGYIEELIFCGDDIRVQRFPEDTRLVYANNPMDEIQDFPGAIRAALDSPLGMEPLERQLHPGSRVVVAFDDPCLPVPLMMRDTRAAVMEVLLERLFRSGIAKDRISLICANGLHRKWTLPELSVVLGRKVIAEMKERISCHDATDTDRLAMLGTTEGGYEVAGRPLYVTRGIGTSMLPFRAFCRPEIVVFHVRAWRAAGEVA